jgi:HSP20 family molecular chaperone IbpA
MHGSKRLPTEVMRGREPAKPVNERKNMITTANQKPRTNKIITTVFIAVATLVVGLVIGASGAENGTKVYNTNTMPGALTNQMSSLSANLNMGGTNAWNPFQTIQNMQAQMDQSFNRMFEQFQMNPQFRDFKNNPGYSLSLNVRDMKKCYQVRAFLPDAKASNIHVNLKNGRTLEVEVNSRQTKSSLEKNETSQVAEWGQYEQVVQLPSPVKADQMKVKHDGHELIITLPKTA